jgi:hypothetical protein
MPERDENWRKSSYSGATNGNCVEIAWRKSSYSGGTNGNCVEIAVGVAAVGVRDSKNVAGPTLAFERDNWAAFLRRTR